jgi:ATP-dependent Zn protease
VRRPDYQGRLEGIKVHLREKPIAADIDYAELATLTGGMSGAQLAGGRRSGLCCAVCKQWGVRLLTIEEPRAG